MALRHEFGLTPSDLESGGGLGGAVGQRPDEPAPESSREAAVQYLLKFFRAKTPLEITDKVDRFSEEVDRLEALYPGVLFEACDEDDRLLEERDQRLFQESGWTEIEPPDYAGAMEHFIRKQG